MRLLSIIIIVFCFSGVFSPLKATHLIGGEVSWECHPQNGSYKFHVKIYRECGFPQTATLPPSVNLMGGPIAIMCSNVNIRKLINPCFDSTQSLSCGVTQVGQGAVEVGEYSSAWVVLNGVPPAGGWTFSWGSCCRPASVVNVVTSSFYIRGTMYGYNNTNASTCYNNSPDFLERPIMAYCNSADARFNHMAVDHDKDSLYFKFVHTKNSSGANAIYANGYSYDNPIPDGIFHPLNTGMILDSLNGAFEFKCLTNGAYNLAIAVEEWRHGQLISEVVKDYPIVVRTCTPSPGLCNQGINTAPSLVLEVDTVSFPNAPSLAPVYGFNGKLQGFESLVNVGDTLRVNVTSLDTNFKSNCTADEIQLITRGLNFTTDSTYADPLQCSFVSPCATLTSLNIGGGFTAPSSNNTLFEWAVDVNHVKYSGMNNNGPVANYKFFFKVNDDQCPMPLANYMTYNVKIVAPVPSPPGLKKSCVDLVASSGDIIFNVIPTLDSADLFKGYVVYHATDKLGPYLPIDTVADFSMNVYNDSGRGAGKHFYFLRTIGNFMSRPSDTVATIHLGVTPNTTSNPTQATLTWNSHLNSTGITAYYQVWKKPAPGANWTLIDSTQSTTYVDQVTGNFSDIEYRVGLNGHCFSVESTVLNIEDNSYLNSIKVAPVPFDNQLIISVPSEMQVEKLSFELFSISGKKVSVESLITNSNELKLLGLKGLSHGVYILHLSANNKTRSFKLIH